MSGSCWNGTVQVSAIRSRRMRGVIFSGYPISKGGEARRSECIVVVVPGAVFCDQDIDLGECWEVQGEARVETRELENGYMLKELTVDAQSTVLVQPSGELIVTLLANSKAFSGIGWRKAETLHRRFGDSLYEILDCRDTEKLTEVLTPEMARRLVEAWEVHGDSRTLRLLQGHKVPVIIAMKVLRFHRGDTMQRLKEDPYRLLSFSADWNVVDNLARSRFEVAVDDPRRLAATVEQGLYDVIAQGHTAATVEMLFPAVTRLLQGNDPLVSKPDAQALAKRALTDLRNKSFFYSDETGCFHLRGAWSMEARVVKFLKRRFEGTIFAGTDLYAGDLDATIRRFEQEEGRALGVSSFALNEEQRNAVITSFHFPFSLITGGAGCGKTTVLKALHYALDTMGLPVFQMALAARAAKRMVEATGKPATTIAYFLRNVTSDQLGQQPVIVIDEASMISVVDMNAIVKRLPPAARMILVGDSFQLPPIGAGLVFHSLCRCEWIPRVELVEVKRQTESSGIPAVAKSIRDGQWCDLPRTGAQTRLIPCDGRNIIDTVMDLYAEDPENTQILAATNKCRLAGVREINTRCQERFASSAKKLLVWNHEHDSWEDTGLREGDPIIYTRNDWARGLLNGSMGTLLRVYPTALDSGDAMACVARAEFEGVEIDVALSDIDYIEPGYAISVHKAQGSQFPRVIIAVRRSRILDRTWIYTSITRAQREFIIVGDRDATKQAVEEPPRAHLRVTGFAEMLGIPR